MAEFGWRGERPLADWLFAEGYRFEFTQAVRLLELLAANSKDAIGKISLGAGSDPEREAARLRAAIGFGFPPREVSSVHAPKPNQPPELIANFFALAGGRAPLPDWVAELVLQQERARDTGLRDFLDIFHHRLLSLLYRMRLHHRPWLDPALQRAVCPGAPTTPPRAGNAMSGYLLAFMGLRTAELRNRMAVEDQELLPYAGLLWQNPRSAAGLERILRHALGVSVSIVEHIGAWRRIEPEDRTCIGRPTPGPRAGRNNRLGRSALLGKRVWDAEGRFDVSLGPLRFAQFQRFSPRGPGFARLRALVRFYAGDLMDVDVELRLASGEAPGLRLGRSRLSQTAWLRPGAHGERRARVSLLSPYREASSA